MLQRIQEVIKRRRDIGERAKEPGMELYFPTGFGELFISSPRIGTKSQGSPKCLVVNVVNLLGYSGDSSRDLFYPPIWKSRLQPFQKVTFLASQKGHKEWPGIHISPMKT